MNKILKFIKNSAFVKSFKELDRRFFWVMSSELLLLLSVLLIVLLSSLIASKGLDNAGISSDLREQINKNFNNDTFAREFLQEKIDDPNYSDKFGSFLSNVIVNVLISLIFIFAAVSFFKSFGWSKIKKEKLTMNFFLRYLGLFSLWNSFWILLILLTARKLAGKLFKITGFTELFLFIYLSLYLYPIFAENKKIFASIKQVWLIGLVNLYKLILPLLSIWIILQIGYVLLFILLKIPVVMLCYAFIFSLFYISWIKFYMLEVIRNVK